RVAVASTGGINTTCRIALWDFKFAGQRDGHKYFIYKFTKTYPEPVAIAASYGAKLLSIETQAENDFLRYQFADAGFIGLNDEASEGNLVWESGAPVTFTSFDDCSWCLPNNETNDYAEFHPWNGKWSFTDGTVPQFFMMEFDCGNPPPTSLTVTSFPSDIQMTVADGTNVSWDLPTATTTCPTGGVTITQISGPSSGSYFPATGNPVTITYSFSDDCGNSTSQSFTVTITPESTGGCPPTIAGFTALGEYNGHKYFLSNTEDTWMNNQALAEANGGYLAVINDAAENAFIQNLISEMVHFGLNDGTSEGVLAWVNGDPVSYTHLSTCTWCGLNDADHDYGIMLPWNGEWSFDHQWAARKMIMEMDCQGGNNAVLTATCPQNIVRTEVDGVGLTWAPSYSTTCTIDGDQVIATQIAGPPPGSYFVANGQPVTITYQFTDDCNNVETCSFTITVNPETSGGCPPSINGFTALGMYNGHKYYLSDGVDNWLNNNALAQSNGGYLTVINDAAENTFLQNAVSEIVHIGYSDEANEGQVVWVNGDPMNYTNFSDCDWCGLNTPTNDYGVFLFWDGRWSFDHPWAARKMIMEMDCQGGNNAVLTATCPQNIVTTAVDGTGLTWAPSYSTTCTIDGDQVIATQIAGPPPGSYFVADGQPVTITYQFTDDCNNVETCSFTITVNPETSGGCPPVISGFSKLGEYNGHGYYLSEDIANWNQAVTLAQNAGGYLTTINDAAENNYILGQINDYVLIGLNDAAQEGQLTWQSGTSSYDNLDGSNTIENDYGVMNFWNGGWSMVNQWVAKQYVVEMSCAAAQPSATVPRAKESHFYALYPNPADDLITIRLISPMEQALSLRVYDFMGQEVLAQKATFPKGPSEISLDIAHLPAGQYFVKVNGSRYEDILRFVKE
ncbi:MAG TPA: HYR domain-containing protein, partial [Saprospiraceae bacterium]|nr:HYR domain-containing protein [Saprospiraceae bacterium]